MKDILNPPKICISKSCISEELDTDLILLDLDSGIYHSLNKFGAMIWYEIKNKKPTLEELLKSFSNKYKSPDVEEDCNSFITELLEKKLIYYE